MYCDVSYSNEAYVLLAWLECGDCENDEAYIISIWHAD